MDIVGGLMRTGKFWWLMLAFTTALYAWYAVQVHQTRYLIDVGISAEAAAIALGLVGVASIGGQIVIGHFSDRVGREWAWTVSLLGFVATYGCLLLLRAIFPSQPLMYAMVFVQGFLGYGMSTVFGAVPAELFAGKRYGGDLQRPWRVRRACRRRVGAVCNRRVVRRPRHL